MKTEAPVETDVTLAVSNVLNYFSFFRHPLRVNEVHSACSIACSRNDVEAALHYLVSEERAYEYQGEFAISSSVHFWAQRKKKGRRLARIRLTSALRYGRFIAHFPFVRFVGISGSLSKGYADHRTDFDFFIITAQDRLWTCRTLLHLMKKLSFLTGMQHRFCMNYFIDESVPAIEEQNYYTALELTTLIPVAGPAQYEQLMEHNRWRSDFLPNGFKPVFSNEPVVVHSSLKRFAEWVLSFPGSALNHRLMIMTDKRWRKKWSKRNYPAEDYSLAFKTTLRHSKNHPDNYQKKLLRTMSGGKDA